MNNRDRVVERWQWDNGHRLEIRRLSQWSYKNLFRRLNRYTAMPQSLAKFFAEEPEWRARAYYALHQTGASFENSKTGRVDLCTLGSPSVRIILDHYWWFGAHVANPRQDLYLLTPPVGTLAELRPPAMSRKWAKRVRSFDSDAARAWARSGLHE